MNIQYKNMMMYVQLIIYQNENRTWHVNFVNE